MKELKPAASTLYYLQLHHDDAAASDAGHDATPNPPTNATPNS